MSGIGDRLKTERVAQGLSLEDIEETTKIRKFYIEAIEKENYEALPDKVYIIGFLRSYSKALKIDPQEIINQFNQSWINPNTENQTNIYNERQIKNKRSSKINLNYNKLMRFGIIVVAILILISINQFWSKHLDDPLKDDIIINEPSENNENIYIPEDIQKDKDTVEEIIYSGVTLEIRPVRGDCWIQVSIDQKPSFSKLITKGEEYLVLEADDQIYIKLGNIDAVDLIFNGELVEEFKDKGPVVEKTFSKLDNS